MSHLKLAVGFLGATASLFGAAMVAPAQSTVDVIVEATHDAQGSGTYTDHAQTGSWITSRTPPLVAKSLAPGLTPQAESATRKFPLTRAVLESTGSVMATARWLVPVPKAGEYYVYATWPRAANASDVDYVVRSNAATTKFTVKQDGRGAESIPNSDQWVLLGRAHFAGTGGESVELQVRPGVRPAKRDAAAQVYADSVRISSVPLTPQQISPMQNLEARLRQAAPPATAAAAASRSAQSGVESAGGLQATTIQPIEWFDDLGAARAAVAKSRKGLIVFFSRGGSERVQRIEKDVLKSPAVARAANGRFLAVNLDINQHAGLAESLFVYRAGTVLVYDKDLAGLAAIQDPGKDSALLEKVLQTGF